MDENWFSPADGSNQVNHQLISSLSYNHIDIVVTSGISWGHDFKRHLCHYATFCSDYIRMHTLWQWRILYNLQILRNQFSAPLCSSCGLTAWMSFRSLSLLRSVKIVGLAMHLFFCSAMIGILKKILWQEHLSSSSWLADLSAISIFLRYQLASTRGAVPDSLWPFHFIFQPSIKLITTQKTFWSL